jgi:hypothetical protein
LLKLLTILGISSALAQEPPQATPLERALQTKLLQEIGTSVSCGRDLAAAEDRIRELTRQLQEKSK